METKSLIARHLSQAKAALGILDTQPVDMEKQRSDLLGEIAYMSEIMA
jgi:hypothetical protein